MGGPGELSNSMKLQAGGVCLGKVNSLFLPAPLQETHVLGSWPQPHPRSSNLRWLEQPPGY